MYFYDVCISESICVQSNNLLIVSFFRAPNTACKALRSPHKSTDNDICLQQDLKFKKLEWSECNKNLATVGWAEQFNRCSVQPWEITTVLNDQQQGHHRRRRKSFPAIDKQWVTANVGLRRCFKERKHDKGNRKINPYSIYLQPFTFCELTFFGGPRYQTE